MVFVDSEILHVDQLSDRLHQCSYTSVNTANGSTCPIEKRQITAWVTERDDGLKSRQLCGVYDVYVL